MAVSIFAMPSSSIILLFSVAFGSLDALPWAGAQQTNVYQPDNWSPRPTAIPVEPARLFKRASVDVNVCGWIGGDLSQVARCGSGSSCVHDTIHGYVGCCATSGPCTDGVYTSCVDKTSPGASADAGMVNNGILTCQEAAACYRNTFPGQFFQYTCGDTNMAGAVQTTYSGQPKDMRLQVVFTGVSFSPMPKPTTTSTSSSSKSSSTSSALTSTETPSPVAAGIPLSTSTESPSPSSTEKSNNSNKANTGAIVGGALGGIAGLVMIAAVLFFFLRRHQQKKNRKLSGGFVSITNKGQSPTSDHFQRICHYSPDDFLAPRNASYQDAEPPNPGSYSSSSIDETAYVSPMTGHPDRILPNMTSALQSTPPRSPEIFASSYETAIAVPIAHHSAVRNSPPVQTYFPPPPREAHPPTSEIDDFSASWNNAIAAQGYVPEGHVPEGYGAPEQDTHMHSGSPPPPTNYGGIGSQLRRAGSTITPSSNKRTQDYQAAGEAIRGASAYDSGDLASSSQELRAAQMADMGFMGAHHGRSDSTSPPPPTSPLKAQFLNAFSAAGRGSARAAAGGSPVRYQLVDEGATRHNLPVLRAPGATRQHRARRSE